MTFSLFLLWASWQLKQSHCLECLQKLEKFDLCPTCLQRYQPLESLNIGLVRMLNLAGETQVPVFVSTPWSQKIRKKWYRYKLMKDYAETALFVSLLAPTALLVIENTQRIIRQEIELKRVWLTHPPARTGKVYPWGRIVKRLAARQGWCYEPNLLLWQSVQASAIEQKTAASKQERQQQRTAAFCATTNPKLLKKLKEQPPQLILLMDDMMTTGATLAGCLLPLRQLVVQHSVSVSSTPQVQVVVLTEVPL